MRSGNVLAYIDKRWKENVSILPYQLLGTPFLFLDKPTHTQHLLPSLNTTGLVNFSWPRFWRTWNVYTKVHLKEFAPESYLTFSKGGIWEWGFIGKSEKTNSCTLPHPLPDTPTHHTHILSYHFWFGFYGPGRFQVPIVFKVCLKYAQNVSKVTTVRVRGPSLPVVAHMQLQKGAPPTAEQCLVHVCRTFIYTL